MLGSRSLGPCFGVLPPMTVKDLGEVSGDPFLKVFQVKTIKNVKLSSLLGSWLQDGPKTVQDGLGCSRGGPKMAQDGSRRSQDGPKMAPRRPKIAQNGSKMAPRWSKMVPRALKLEFLGRVRSFLPSLSALCLVNSSSSSSSSRVAVAPILGDLRAILELF